DVDHPEAAEPVEELGAAAVVEICPLPASPLAVEADDLEDLDEARVRVTCVQRHPFAGTLREQLVEAETGHERSLGPGCVIPPSTISDRMKPVERYELA